MLPVNVNSPDSTARGPKKIEQEQQNAKEDVPSFNVFEDSLQDASGQADSCGKVSLDFVHAVVL